VHGKGCALAGLAYLGVMNDERLHELEEEFSFLDDWEQRYRHVIDLGREVPELAEDERVEASKVRGCASQVWLVSHVDQGLVYFRGQSDAAIVQGLLAILLRLYSGRPASQIFELDAGMAFGKLGLAEALSPQRSNGLKAMALRIREVAQGALSDEGVE
jgi:cysteine desulfuration protein SufE